MVLYNVFRALLARKEARYYFVEGCSGDEVALLLLSVFAKNAEPVKHTLRRTLFVAAVLHAVCVELSLEGI